MKIVPDHHYQPNAPELRQIAKPQTLARWRHEGIGPAYVKAGGRRILYRGIDLLDWLQSHRIETAG